MTKNLLIFVCAVFATSCIDKDYDLSKVKTDNITIGDDNSIYKLPLAKINIALNKFVGGGTRIEEVLEEAKIWLPTTLPGGKDYVELNRAGETAYVNTLMDALINEMLEAKTDKLDKMTTHIYTKYKDDFLPLLNLPAGTEITEELYKTTFKQQFTSNPEIQDNIREKGRYYLQEIQIDPIQYETGELDMDDELIDIIVKNLDPASVKDPKNTLHIYGEIQNGLPVSMRLDPSFTQTSVVIENILVEANSGNSFGETRLLSEDITIILNGSSVILLPIELQKYYPNRPFDSQEDKQMVITLRLVKRGGLTFGL